MKCHKMQYSVEVAASSSGVAVERMNESSSPHAPVNCSVYTMASPTLASETTVNSFTSTDRMLMDAKKYTPLNSILCQSFIHPFIHSFI